MFAATPVAKTIRPKKNVANPTTGPRRTRSASQPSGTMPRTRNPPEIPETNTITPELTWKDCWMLGASTASPELCRLSRATITNRIEKVVIPAFRRPGSSGVRSSLVPGRRSSGRTTSSGFSALWRSMDESTTAWARAVTLLGSLSVRSDLGIDGARSG